MFHEEFFSNLLFFILFFCISNFFHNCYITAANPFAYFSSSHARYKSEAGENPTVRLLTLDTVALAGSLTALLIDSLLVADLTASLVDPRADSRPLCALLESTLELTLMTEAATTFGTTLLVVLALSGGEVFDGCSRTRGLTLFCFFGAAVDDADVEPVGVLCALSSSANSSAKYYTNNVPASQLAKWSEN